MPKAVILSYQSNLCKMFAFELLHWSFYQLKSLFANNLILFLPNPVEEDL